MILQGLLDALSTIAWVVLLLLIIVYCIGVFLTTAVGHSDYAKEHWIYTEQYAGTVMRSMWTVMQIMTFDMWATDIARPMNDVSPGIVIVILGTIVICSFGVLNVVVAVMVQQ